MALLKRENALRSTHLEMVEIDVTEWGDVNPETGKREKTTVYVRELTAKEAEKLGESLTIGKGKKARTSLVGYHAKIAVLACCDADGNSIFTSEDVSALESKSSSVLARIAKAVNKLSSIFADEDDEDAEDPLS